MSAALGSNLGSGDYENSPDRCHVQPGLSSIALVRGSLQVSCALQALQLTCAGEGLSWFSGCRSQIRDVGWGGGRELFPSD
jgi:hypothetical protein